MIDRRPMSAADLATNFRQMSSTRDRTISSIDRSVAAGSRSSTPLTLGRERTIIIGGSRSRSNSPRQVPLFPPSPPRPAMFGDLGFNSRLPSPASVTTGVASGFRDLSKGPLSFATLSSQAEVPGSRHEQIPSADEDCFDRAGVMQLLATHQRAASPREYAPEFEGEFEVPQVFSPPPPPRGTVLKDPMVGMPSDRGIEDGGIFSPPPKIPGGNGNEAMTWEQTTGRSASAVMDFNGIPIPVPPALALASFSAAPAVRSPSGSLPFRQPAPSSLLTNLTHAISQRRGLTSVPTIPSDVIEAFDVVVKEGAYFVKYSNSGSPHERYFQIRFVDVQGGPPEPCLSWAVHRTSWSAKGLMNLIGLRKVIRGVEGNEAFRKHLVDSKRIRGPMMSGPQRAVLPTSFAMQLVPTGDAEALSLLSLNAEVFDAWFLVLSFIASL